MLEALRGREHKIDYKAHFFYLAYLYPLSLSLYLFSYSLSLLSSLTYLIDKVGLYLSFNYIIITLSFNNN